MPWPVQVGCLRDRFYADDLLDNLGHPSASIIISQFQHLEVGQWIAMAPTPAEVSAFKVAGFKTSRWLVWEQPVSSWAWQLRPVGDNGTRLVTTVRTFYDWQHRARAVSSLLFNEFGDLPSDATHAAGHQTPGREPDIDRRRSPWRADTR